ncbi:MAG: hypothetical protein MJ071_04840 [Oscillospiraceae bacterium]|nr:hypothetical protein [Oscillospiraceae bacterium]
MKKAIRIINLLLITAMTVHVTCAVIIHSKHPEYSAPAYVELFNAVFYLVPMAIINAIALLHQRHSKRSS